jgi:hypothetical protein
MKKGRHRCRRRPFLPGEAVTGKAHDVGRADGPPSGFAGSAI